MNPSLPRLLHASDNDIPPPRDMCPEFPDIFFDARGVPHPGSPIRGSNIITQVVPVSTSWFTRQFGLPCFSGGWVEPETVLEDLGDWQAAGGKIYAHSRRSGMRVTGIGRGRPRFLCGGGFSLFIGGELGLVPDGMFADGRELINMVATFAVSIPASGAMPVFADAAMHLIPAEYLKDPEYPGLLSPLTLSEANFHLPPPPYFVPGLPCSEFPGFRYARVYVLPSFREIAEDGLDFCDRFLRGGSYRRLLGLPIL